MKTTWIAVLLAAFALGMAPRAFAAEPTKRTPGIHRREKNQARRIRQGVKSGELTKEEAQGLRQDEKQIRQMKRDAKADGTVTPEERQQINQSLTQESQKIYQEKHDAEKRK